MHPSQVSRRQYELERGSMYQVEVTVDCPTCGDDVLCTVYGCDVEITIGCKNICEGESHFDQQALNDAALAQAQSERAAYAQHEAEYDPR